MTTFTATSAARYLAFWNAENPEQKRELAPDVFTGDVTYHAPAAVLTGPEALIDFSTRFAEQRGPATLATRAEPDHHHDRVRVQWEILLAGGESFAEGTDVLVVDPDGRISSVSTFLDRAPEGFVPPVPD